MEKEAHEKKENAVAAQNALDKLVIDLSYDDDDDNKSILRKALPEEIQNAGNEMTARLTKQQALASSYFQSGTQADLDEYLFMFREDLERAGIPETQRDIDAAKQKHIMETLYNNGSGDPARQNEFTGIYKTRIDNVNKGLAKMLTVGELARALYKKDSTYREHIENIGGLDKFIEHLETISPDTTHQTIGDLRSQMSSVLSGQQESHQQNINNIVALAGALDISRASNGKSGNNFNLAEAVKQAYGPEFLGKDDNAQTTKGLNAFRNDPRYKHIPPQYFLIAAATVIKPGGGWGNMFDDDEYDNSSDFDNVASLAENLYEQAKNDSSKTNILNKINVESLLTPPTPAYGDINEFRLDKIRINPSSNNDFFNTLTFAERQTYLNMLTAQAAAARATTLRGSSPQTNKTPPPQTSQPPAQQARPSPRRGGHAAAPGSTPQNTSPEK